MGGLYGIRTRSFASTERHAALDTYRPRKEEWIGTAGRTRTRMVSDYPFSCLEDRGDTAAYLLEATEARSCPH